MASQLSSVGAGVASKLRSPSALVATPPRVRRFNGQRKAVQAQAQPQLTDELKDVQELSERLADVASTLRLQLLFMLRAKSSVDEDNAELRYLSQRLMDVTAHFPTAMSMEDFLMRTEMALCAHGLRGDNCIACTNLCRDESTGIFKEKIDGLFGSSFNINGLGACLTCGCVGMGAGLSHAPTCSQGKDRYVFFSFPHIAIDSEGKVGAISRPGRSGASSACGAMIGALAQMQASGVDAHLYDDGEHDALDPEFSILKTRMARRIKADGLDINSMDLVQFTALAERMISDDLELLISKTVDTSKADYAVVTGVHVHSWQNEGTEAPTLEFIAPTMSYVVTDGERTDMNLNMALLSGVHDYPTLGGAALEGTSVVEVEQKDPAARKPTDVSKFGDIAAVPQQLAHEMPSWSTIFASEASKLPEPVNAMN